MNGDVCCVKEIRSAMEREAFEMRDGLIAFQHGYNLANCAVALAVRARDVLEVEEREGGLTEVVK